MNKISLLIIALLLALGAAGTGHAMWFDESITDGDVNTGTWDSELVGGGTGGISIEVRDADTLRVTVTTPNPGVEYLASFAVHHQGTVPVRIQALEARGVPAGTDVSITGLAVGDFVYPDSIETGQVSVTLTAPGDENDPENENNEVAEDIVFDIYIERVLWTNYVP